MAQFYEFTNNLITAQSKNEKLDILREGLDDPTLKDTILSFIDPVQRSGPKPEALKGIGPATIEALRPGILESINLINLMKPVPKFEEDVEGNSEYQDWYIKPVIESARVFIDLPNNLIRASNTFFRPLVESPLKTDLSIFSNSLILDGFLYLTGETENNYANIFTRLRQVNCQEFSFALIDYVSESNYQTRQNYLNTFSYSGYQNISYESPSLKSNVSIEDWKDDGVEGYFLYHPTGMYTTNNQSNSNFISVRF